jgi:hypothetical protein
VSAVPRLLLDLGQAGVEVAAHGDRLRHRPATLAPDLSARLRMHKAAILAILADGYAPDAGDGPEAGYILGERLGIADDLGMPTHPGAPAWLIAVGESMDSSCNHTTIAVE